MASRLRSRLCCVVHEDLAEVRISTVQVEGYVMEAVDMNHGDNAQNCLHACLMDFSMQRYDLRIEGNSAYSCYGSRLHHPSRYKTQETRITHGAFHLIEFLSRSNAKPLK